jgi:arylsulfatase A-like enzyme
MDEFLWRQLPFVVSHDNGMFFEPNEYMTDYLSKEAVKAIKAATRIDERVPFYLQVWFNAPHNPLHATIEDYNSPELSNITSHRLRVYAAMIKGLDRGVKRILDALEETHQADNTIVIFSSDNGGAEYVGLRDINKPFRGWKGTFYEGGLRVPMFMKWPAKIPRMTTVREPVGHVDIFPTIALAARIPDSLRQKWTKVVAILLRKTLKCCTGGLVTMSPPESATGKCSLRTGQENCGFTIFWRIQLSSTI